LNALWLCRGRLTTWSGLHNKIWVLVITRDPPANAQCISFNLKFWSGVPKARVVLWLADVPVLFIGCLILDELYSKLNRLLDIQVGGLKVIASVVFKTRLGLEVEGGSFNVGLEVIYRSLMYLCYH
jgi:hypothetical protein